MAGSIDCGAESMLMPHTTASGNELTSTHYMIPSTHHRDGSRAFVTGTFTEVCRFFVDY